MDATKARRARLKQWIEDSGQGSAAQFCRYYGLPDSRASYLSQLLSGHRNFGERAARNLEQACRKPAGWLDANISSPPLELNYDKALFSRLPASDRHLIEDFVALVIARHEAKAEPLSKTKNFGEPSESVAAASRRTPATTFNKNETKENQAAKSRKHS